jgi:hypothetical protein
MANTQRLYMLCATIALAAMVSRVGWINWPDVGHVLHAAWLVAILLAVLLVVAALVVGVPTVLLIGLLNLVDRREPLSQPADPVAQPATPASGPSVSHRPGRWPPSTGTAPPPT